MWRISLWESKSAKYEWSPTVDVWSRRGYEGTQTKRKITDLEESLNWGVDGSRPSIGEYGIICVSQSWVLDQVLEVAVWSSSPRLWWSWKSMNQTRRKTYHITFNGFTRRWVNNLCGQPWLEKNKSKRVILGGVQYEPGKGSFCESRHHINYDL